MEDSREKLGLTKEKRILAEDILKTLFQAEYDGKTSDLASIAGRVGVAQNEVVNIISHLIEQGYVKRIYDSHQLTEQGREFGLMLTRAHRICETYFAQQTGISAEEWHPRAHEMEHRLSADEINQLADKLGNPRFDPHGDPIPTRDGKLPSMAGTPLTEWEEGKSAMIVHIEDEPEVVYARLIAAEISPGIRIKILESSNSFLM
jgi:DtxR family Mn-dependent transcriptional regulator